MSFFEQLSLLPEVPACTKIFCEKIIPEKIIAFHKDILKRSYNLAYYTIFLQDVDMDELFVQLSVTLLGDRAVFALKDGDLSVASRKKIDAFLKEYTGPHDVFFFTYDPSYKKNAYKADISISKKDFQTIVSLTAPMNIASSFISQLYKTRDTYTFDEAVMFIRYADLLGGRHDLFFSEWYPRLLADDISLFTLSTYFFAQQKSSLVAEWNRLKNKYPVEFWISFFSEQLWQASLYLRLARQGRAVEAKRYAYRLPYSFFQKDYKRYSLNSLAQAHKFLYLIDYGLKNGYATDGFDLFIHTSFTRIL